MAGVRILADPNDPKDLAQVHTLQNAITVAQPGGPGRFEVPNWDETSHKKVRDALVALGETIPDWRRATGRKGEVDEVRHLIVTATGWGLNPDKDAIYLNITPDGNTIYRLNVGKVPVDGFWSISLYNADAISSKTHSTRTRSTTSPRKQVRMGRSRSSSAVATARHRTACRS